MFGSCRFIIDNIYKTRHSVNNRQDLVCVCGGGGGGVFWFKKKKKSNYVYEIVGFF